MVFLATHLAIDMVKVGKRDYLDSRSLSSLKDVLIGGKHMPSKYLLILREVLPNVNVAQLYGQTEVAGVITLFRSCTEAEIKLLNDKPRSCGRPVPGFWYKVTLIFL